MLDATITLGCYTDAPQSGQVKRKGPKSTKSQAKRQRTASPPPPPPRSLIHVESFPSSLEVQTRQAPSSPQPEEVPRPEEISVDVLEQTADPVGSIISSVVSSIQTSTAPPQGKVLSIRLFADDFFFNLQHSLLLYNFQLTSFHRQLQAINPWYHRLQLARGEKLP